MSSPDRPGRSAEPRRPAESAPVGPGPADEAGRSLHSAEWPLHLPTVDAPGAHTHRELFPTAFAERDIAGLPQFRVIPPPPPPPAEAAKADPADIPAAVAPLATILAGRRFAVLTGAGISTDSGVPDYRSPGSPPRQPMTIQQFLADPAFRRHYWARNHLGWRYLAETRPNSGHLAIAALEGAGLLTGVVTQNIDRLHDRAGSHSVVHLHGRFDRVECHSCGQVTSRADLDVRLTARNPGWRERHLVDVELAPDADAALASTDDFRTADCSRCGGVLVPDVVFFGSNVPRDRMDRARRMVADAKALLVAGTSLAVNSGLRLVRQAVRSGIPAVAVNRGPLRGAELLTRHVEAGTSEALPELAIQLGAPPGAAG